MLSACVVTWIMVEDEEALESGMGKLLFLDAYGRVVKTTRVEANEVVQFGGGWADGCWDEIGEWEEGVLGEEYRLGGACGDLLLETMRNA